MHKNWLFYGRDINSALTVSKRKCDDGKSPNPTSTEENTRRNKMSSGADQKNQTRRSFFSDVTASTALAAVAMA
jgi:hypothetical protein